MSAYAAFGWRGAITFIKLTFKLLNLAGGYAVFDDERPVKAGVRARVVVLGAQKEGMTTQV